MTSAPEKATAFTTLVPVYGPIEEEEEQPKISQKAVLLEKTQKKLTEARIELARCHRLCEEQAIELKKLSKDKINLGIDVKMANQQVEIVQNLYESALKNFAQPNSETKHKTRSSTKRGYTQEEWTALQNQMKLEQEVRQKYLLKIEKEKKRNIESQEKIELLKFCLKRARDELVESKKKICSASSIEQETFVSPVIKSSSREEEGIVKITLDSVQHAKLSDSKKRPKMLVSTGSIPHFNRKS